MAQDAGSIYSEIRIKLDKLSGDIQIVNKKFDQLGKNIQQQSQKTETNIKKSFSAIGLAGPAAIGAVTLAFKSSISTFARTEQSLANVAAVSNASASEFDQLKKAAENAGTTTRFTASQAADALFFLSSAGLSATQSVDALSGVLELAGATGSDLSQSAQTITATLSQFGLAADKAADVSNVFAAANSNSQATLSRLQNSLRQVGSVAGAFNIGLEEVVGSLQVLYNAGFEGEASGRALKSALADLGNESSVAVKKLNDLGVSFVEVNPETVGLTGAIGNLEEAGLSTAQILEVFGTVAGPQLVTLIGAGEDALKEYEEAVTGTNEAARQYAVQNDTLSGSFDAFKSATEGASNALISTLSPIFRGVLDLSSSLIRIFTKLPDVLKAISAGAGVAAGGFIALQKALQLLGIALGGSLGIISLVGAVSVGLVTLGTKFVDARDRTDELESSTSQLKKTSSEYKDTVDKLSENTDTLTESEKALLENRKKLLALDIQKQLSELADNYDAVNRQIDMQIEKTEKSRAEVNALLLISRDREAAEKRLSELMAKSYSAQSLTTSEAEEYQTLLENINKNENRLANQLQNKNDALLDNERALAEITGSRQESLQQIAQAVADGTVDISVYKDTETELYNQIIEIAEQIKENNKLREDSNNLSGDSLDIDKERESIIRTIAGIRGLEASGIITQNESLDRQISFRKDLLTQYEDQAIADGGLTDEILANIREQESELQALYDLKDQLSSKSTETTLGKQDTELTNFIKTSEAKVNAEIEELSKREQALLDFEAEKERIRAEEKAAEEADRAERIQKWSDYYSQIAGLATDLFSVLAELALKNAELEIEEINKVLEADIAANQASLESDIASIDSATQKKLESLGLLEETKAETLLREIEEAKTAGDTELENEKQKELDRLLILQKAEEDKKAIEEKAARDRSDIEEAAAKRTAQIQYEAELAAWRLQKASALVLASQAILQGYAQLGPVGGSLAATGTAIVTGLQLDLIEKNKPQPPALQTGGIVLPQRGGTLATLAENGSPELALNAGAEGQELLGQFAQQIVDKMGGNQGRDIVLNIDGLTFAKYIADIYYSSGVVTIDGRAIR